MHPPPQCHRSDLTPKITHATTSHTYCSSYMMHNDRPFDVLASWSNVQVASPCNLRKKHRQHTTKLNNPKLHGRNTQLNQTSNNATLFTERRRLILHNTRTSPSLCINHVLNMSTRHTSATDNRSQPPRPYTPSKISAVNVLRTSKPGMSPQS